MSTLVDTSVLVRYLTGEPPELAQNAIEIIDSGESLAVTEVALVETAHALRTF